MKNEIFHPPGVPAFVVGGGQRTRGRSITLWREVISQISPPRSWAASRIRIRLHHARWCFNGTQHDLLCRTCAPHTLVRGIGISSGGYSYRAESPGSSLIKLLCRDITWWSSCSGLLTGECTWSSCVIKTSICSYPSYLWYYDSQFLYHHDRTRM